MKQGEAKTEEERTQALADKLKEVESQIKELTDAPAKIKIEADIQQAIDGINTTLVALGQLQDKTVTVTVKTVQEGQQVAASGGGSDAPPGFAEGGYTGSTGGIVHPYEQVIRADVVAQPGVRAMLETLNRGGCRRWHRREWSMLLRQPRHRQAVPTCSTFPAWAALRRRWRQINRRRLRWRSGVSRCRKGRDGENDRHRRGVDSRPGRTGTAADL